MADKSIQQPKGKISVALGGKKIHLAFLIKTVLLPRMLRFSPTSLVPKTRATHF